MKTVLAEFGLGELLWSLFVFFFWFMAIWVFIVVFGDIFRRNDIGGAAKAGWLILVFVLPVIGVLIYLIARPRMTEQDRQMILAAQEAERRATGYSTADEIAKLTQLRDEGKISAEEYESLKRRAM